MDDGVLFNAQIHSKYMHTWCTPDTPSTGSHNERKHTLPTPTTGHTLQSGEGTHAHTHAHPCCQVMRKVTVDGLCLGVAAPCSKHLNNLCMLITKKEMSLHVHAYLRTYVRINKHAPHIIVTSRSPLSPLELNRPTPKHLPTVQCWQAHSEIGGIVD